MIYLLFTAALLLWLIQRQWRMRRILKLSRELRNKYTAWPIVGHGLMFLGSAEGRMKAFQNLGREAIKSKYGSISLWQGSTFCIMTCDSTIAGLVSNTCLEKPKAIFQAAKHLMGNAPLFSPVSMWRPRRKILASAFNTKNLRAFVQVFAEQSIILTECLKSKAGTGTFTIWKNMTTYTMDSVFQTIFGLKIETQKQPLHPFLSALSEYLQIIPTVLIAPSLPWKWLFDHVPLSVFKEFNHNKATIHDFVNNIIKNKVASLQHNYDDVDRHYKSDEYENHLQSASFLDKLIILSSAANDGTRGYTEVELREETLLLLSAGNDTSAVGTCFVIAMLSRHPDVQEKAYEEVRSIFGDSKRPVTNEDLKKLIYLEALINETLRLYPPVPITYREVDADIELGLVAPAGTFVIFNIWGLHRNPKYWGAEAEQFNPDRFLNGSPVDRSAYMPFAYGPRNCIGYKYAMMSMKIVAATLLREYKLLPPSEMSPEDWNKPLRLEYCIMSKDVDNFKVRLENRM